MVLSPEGEGQLGVSFAHALSREGHDTDLIPARPLTGGSRELIAARRLRLGGTLSAMLCRRLQRRLADLRPDLTIVIKGRFLTRKDVARLRKASHGAVVNYYPDNPFSPQYHEPAVLDALPAYDRVFIWSEDLVSRLRAAGVPRASYLPFGYDDELYSAPVSDEPPEWDVGFVGQWYSLREHHIRALAGMRVVVAGPGWRTRLERQPVQGCTVLTGNPHGRRAAEVYHRSKIGLNILHPDNANSHNMRTWELPATGTASIMTASDFHARLFGATGVVAVQGAEDLRGAVERLLADGSVRRDVADAGHAAVKAGTYRARMKQLLEMLGGAEPRAAR